MTQQCTGLLHKIQEENLQKMISNIFLMFTLKVLRVLFALAVNFALDEADGRHFSSIDLLQMVSKLR
jgi:hypothetical protein